MENVAIQMAYNKEKSDAELRQERTKISMLEKENELKRSRMFIFVFSK